MNAAGRRAAAAALVALGVCTVACGKTGPPLPPLVRLPAAPDLKAARRGDAVDLQVTVPSANTDGTRPANVQRVDVYAYTGPTAMTDAELIKRGTKVASLAVKAPKDPDETIEPDQPRDDLDPLSGEGLDQGAVSHVEDQLAQPGQAAAASSGPLLGPLIAAPLRTYVSVGITTRGKTGPFSRRVAVPGVPAPPMPENVAVAYDEKAITVSWSPVGTPAPAASPDVLPAHPLVGPDATSYMVYDQATRAALTTAPIAETRFQDARIEWGAERCYSVRAVRVVATVRIESEGTEPVCKTLVDTFPPAAPKGLTVVAGGSGTMSLIWTANTEADLAGYVILRGVAGGPPPAPITPMPITQSIFNDTVQAGTRYVYVIKAVDAAGNQSDASMPAEETAR